MKFTVEWLKAAAIRMIRTAAQVALGMLTVGMTLREVDWINVASVSAVAAVYSLLTSIITDLPEVGNDGVLKIEKNGDVAGIDFNSGTNDISKKTVVKLHVDEVEK